MKTFKKRLKAFKQPLARFPYLCVSLKIRAHVEVYCQSQARKQSSYL